MKNPMQYFTVRDSILKHNIFYIDIVKAFPFYGDIKTRFDKKVSSLSRNILLIH